MGQFEVKDSGVRVEYTTGARRDTNEGKGRFDLLPMRALRRFAAHLQKGAKKYGDRNWEEGIPVSRCYDSALRHLTQALQGHTDEDHLAAVLFNVSAIIEFQERLAEGILSPNKAAAIFEIPEEKVSDIAIASVVEVHHQHSLPTKEERLDGNVLACFVGGSNHHRAIHGIMTQVNNYNRTEVEASLRRIGATPTNDHGTVWKLTRVDESIPSTEYGPVS